VSAGCRPAAVAGHVRPVTTNRVERRRYLTLIYTDTRYGTITGNDVIMASHTSHLRAGLLLPAASQRPLCLLTLFPAADPGELLRS